MMDDIDRSFTWWQNALKGERGPIDADNPRSGFYRSKAKDKSLHAVAIWYDSNTQELRYQQDGRDVDDLRARERWPHDSKRPISEETFWAFRDTGVWPDVDGAAQSQSEGSTEINPVLALAAKILAAKENVSAYAKIESDEQATKARSLQTTLLDYKGEAVKAHKKEKEPWLEGGRSVDKTWFPLRDDADKSAIEVRTALEEWELAKRKGERAAEARGVPSNMPAPAAKITGGGGRSATPKPWWEVISIDIDAAFLQFKQNPDVHRVLMELAQDAIDAGIAVPGAKTEERIRLR